MITINIESILFAVLKAIITLGIGAGAMAIIATVVNECTGGENEIAERLVIIAKVSFAGAFMGVIGWLAIAMIIALWRM